MRSQSPDTQETATPSTRLIGDMAVPYGLHPIVVESVGFVSGLKGTGCDPEASPQRSLVMHEMQREGIESPNALLASPNTTIVMVRGTLRPGVQKGDRFDLEVRALDSGETTSLRGGNLWTSELKQLAVMADNRIHGGHVLATGKGAILVDPIAKGEGSKILQCRGRILGGGVAHQSRPLMLVLQPEHQSVRNSARIQEVINRRFSIFDRGNKVGVAKAKTDEAIELVVHPRYYDNVDRYLRVIRSLPMRESERELSARLLVLEKQLLDPISSSRAALQLEAMGNRGVDTLRKGLNSNDPEVRFYSAESLAYLDESGVAAYLAEAAANQPAFRVFALTALSTMEDFESQDQLHNLLDSASAETRYGAFRALTVRRNPDPFVQGRNMREQFTLHVLPVSGAPMVHVARSKRPEIVLFGRDQMLSLPVSVDAGNEILVNSTPEGQIILAKYTVGEPDQRRTVSPRLEEVIGAIVDLGGSYPDVVQALQEAQASGAPTSRFEVDALPAAGRTYDRIANAEGEGEEPELRANSPVPDLFSSGEKVGAQEAAPPSTDKPAAAESDQSEEKSEQSDSVFAKILGSRRS
ncbi:MAG: flagellar basal body P-ring protein FlgI [Thermoguttaceae bacterium]